MDVVIESYMNAIKQLESSGTKLVDKTVWNHRLDICKKCENYEQYDINNNEPIFKCKKCGCLGIQFKIKSTKCPLKLPNWR